MLTAEHPQEDLLTHSYKQMARQLSVMLPCYTLDRTDPNGELASCVILAALMHIAQSNEDQAPKI